MMMLINEKYLVFLCGFLRTVFALNIKFNNHTVDLMDILIPTLHSESEICKNHSLMYLKQLSKFTVWATDMFDASTKFPNGIFFGSSYNTGNFDECVKVLPPKNEGFSGQHCMAYFKIKPPKPVLVGSISKSSYNQYESLYNVSTWKKLRIYGENRMKHFRDETYISFCIPSTCSYKDLEESLKKKVDIIEDLFSMKVEINVNERNCQVERKIQYSQNDMIFVGIVAALILFEIFCTVYHILTNLVGMENWKLSGKMHEIIRAFSFSNTLRKITSKSNKDDGTHCIHGFKAIATLWVIFGHRVMFTMGAPQQNPVFVEHFYGNIVYSMFHNAPIIVDTFFTISGFLACYLILWDIEIRKKLNICLVYFHRFIRLTPVYAVFLGFYCTVFYQLGDGPFWEEKVGVEKDRCRETWWTNILYINNYIGLNKTCMFHSWYLSADTQLFFIVPILAYLLWKHQKLGLIVGTILIAASVIIQGVIIYASQDNPFMIPYFNSNVLQDAVLTQSYQNSHIPSYMRGSPYFVGAIAGFVKFKLRITGNKIPRSVRVLFWTLCSIIMFAILISAYLFYIPREEDQNYIVSGVYSSMHRFLWAVCTAWCIVGVSEGYGQLIAPILNWDFWRILSRITLTTYLTHGTYHLYSFATIRSPVHVGFFNLLTSTVSDIVLIYTIGLCLSLVFESPIIELENIVLKRKSKSLESNVKDEGKESEKHTTE